MTRLDTEAAEGRTIARTILSMLLALDFASVFGPAASQTADQVLPSGLELRPGSAGLSQNEDGASVGLVRNGNAADNRFGGTSAEESFKGAAGNDTLIGYEGFDRYSFQPGDGIDTIYDYHPEGNLLVFRGGIAAGDLIIAEEENANGFRDRVITYGDGEVIRIADWSGLPETTRSAWRMEFLSPAEEASLDAAQRAAEAATLQDAERIASGPVGQFGKLPLELIFGIGFVFLMTVFLVISLRRAR